MEWDFTLSGESLIRVSWEIESNNIIGTKTASGAVTLFPVFKGQFNISPNDRATLIIHNATAADGKKIMCLVTFSVRDWNDIISVVIKGECSFCCFTKCICTSMCIPNSSIFRIILLTAQGNVHYGSYVNNQLCLSQGTCAVENQIV